MDAKSFFVLFITINCYYSSCGAALRRTPKVYNALITTDENLTSSRAYPLIQPTIHESGVAHYPFGPFGVYGPLVRFGQPIAPGLVSRQQYPYPLPNAQFPPQFIPQTAHSQSYPGQLIPQKPTPTQQESIAQEAPIEQQEASAAEQPKESLDVNGQPGQYMPLADGPRPQLMPKEKIPLPLNGLGLPPALIPLQQYAPHGNINPVNLPPYQFNQYPLLYDPITGFREQYLPPYFYSNTFAVGATPPRGVAYPQPNHVSSSSSASNAGDEKSEDPAVETDSAPINYDDPKSIPNFEDIKNGPKNKNSDIPDVLPPPVGAKVKRNSVN